MPHPTVYLRPSSARHDSLPTAQVQGANGLMAALLLGTTSTVADTVPVRLESHSAMKMALRSKPPQVDPPNCLLGLRV
eukprot:364636-Chlamydomonas_euryale.AAC.5